MVLLRVLEPYTDTATLLASSPATQAGRGTSLEAEVAVIHHLSTSTAPRWPAPVLPHPAALPPGWRTLEGMHFEPLGGGSLEDGSDGSDNGQRMAMTDSKTHRDTLLSVQHHPPPAVCNNSAG